ncbi:TPA: hypothetical protein N0F65_002753 [Lagenidium giganteum]|uniref:Beta-lactamase-related domain-containing protein n=1 Tax=Lagenidium giganteum TaxID=4803 RepID=A0AAV2YKI1_9STRA|nr:TPA: hypothetical protein N0F65_002753 [Lagenidium giganteum]
MRQIIKEGRFQKANRTLSQMQSEADAFLQQAANQFPNVGFAVSVVYQDKPVLAKGYGSAVWQMPGSLVNADTIFQIGSFSKSFIAVGIGMLVDAGLAQWDDPVKKHLPWLQLADKYMEEHVTLGDLMAMNSGFGPYQGDEAVFFGFDSTERATAERLKFLPPAGSLRSGHTYVNINTLLLGQVIEAVSKKPWPQFLRERVFVPLGMKRTFTSIQAAKAKNATNIAAGHLVCGTKVKGPYQLTDDKVNLVPGYKDGNLAAGSIVSTANDLAQFARFLLSNGTVGNATLFSSPTILERMTTAKVELNDMFTLGGALAGLLPTPRGGYGVGPGYGFDTTGQVLWDHAYFDKGGDTIGHQSRNGFLPEDKLGVVILRNAQGSNTLHTDILRSYVAGIFLDIPKKALNKAYDAELAAAAMLDDAIESQSDVPKGGECGPEMFNITRTTKVPSASKWVGKYVQPDARDYAPLKLQVLGNGDLQFQYGRVNGTVRYIDNAPSPQFDAKATSYRVLVDSNGIASAFGYLVVSGSDRVLQFADKAFIKIA